MAEISKDKPVRRHMNAAQKRALKAADIRRFVRQYGRLTRPGGGLHLNDRDYDREIEQMVRSMSPEELDRLMHDDEE
jgi:hypothetical protein